MIHLLPAGEPAGFFIVSQKWEGRNAKVEGKGEVILVQ